MPHTLAPTAARPPLIIAHGNEPQVGLLALQTAAYDRWRRIRSTCAARGVLPRIGIVEVVAAPVLYGLILLLLRLPVSVWQQDEQAKVANGRVR